MRVFSSADSGVAMRQRAEARRGAEVRRVVKRLEASVFGVKITQGPSAELGIGPPQAAWRGAVEHPSGGPSAPGGVVGG